ncbi:hypothetical protein KP509_03G087500 [Ceratopteris richardii]|uniref:Uncharacterized protein n=1 Tax=Ceratopteris richardii TaxID=49495 RepID=A0A8T2V8U0_CERRI|nr:hypothetical protein KP509_03G087500 [Ceratopteris richardii]
MGFASDISDNDGQPKDGENDAHVMIEEDYLECDTLEHQMLQVEADESNDGDENHMIPCRGCGITNTSRDEPLDMSMEVGDCGDTETAQLDDNDARDSQNATSVLTTLEDCPGESREFCSPTYITNGNLHKSSAGSDIDQENMIKNSVQQWVDSLMPEEVYDNDPTLHCSDKCAVGCEKHACYGRSPLHEHLGYRSPLQLFEKVAFSEDDELRVRMEIDSTTSSSSTPYHACHQQRAGSSATQESANGEEKPFQKILNSDRASRNSWKGLLRRTLKRRSSSMTESRVVVNGHVLTNAAIRKAEERAGKIRPGSYWYDCKAGFWGVEGGPCRGVLPPFILELNFPMAVSCSDGDTQVYVNGRELHSKDLAILAGRGFPIKPCMAYSLAFDGVLIDETTGLEVKQLGKLAPTVECRGRGFGMFAGDIHGLKTRVVHDSCAE